MVSGGVQFMLLQERPVIIALYLYTIVHLLLAEFRISVKSSLST